MVRFIAQALSYIFHPILIPTLSILTLSIAAPTLLFPLREGSLLVFCAFVFICTYLVPAAAIYVLYLAGAIRNWQLDDREDRLIGIAVTSIVYSIFAFVLYSRFRANNEVMLLFYISIGCQLVSMAITRYWKVSLHSIAIWGMVCYLISLVVLKKADVLLWSILSLIVVSGALMAARLYLQKHTLGQVAAGVFLSTIVSTILFFVMY